jgi:hypothetical protein
VAANDGDWPLRERRGEPSLDAVLVATVVAETNGNIKMLRRLMQDVKGEVERTNRAGYITQQQLPLQVLAIPEVQRLRDDALRREGAANVWRWVTGGGGLVALMALALSLGVAFHIIK